MHDHLLEEFELCDEFTPDDILDGFDLTPLELDELILETTGYSAS